nr:beta-glucosidase [Butyrivibrio sp.]
EWGYKGFVMTDWFTSQHVPFLTGDAPVKYPISSSPGCVYAGNDVQMPGCEQNVKDIENSINEGAESLGFTCTLAQLQHSCAAVIRTALKCI